MANLTLDLSDEAAELKRSVMRDLLGLAVDPGIISLAGGLPASDHMPIEEFRECINLVLDRDGARAMQYSPQYMPLRRWIASYMESRGVACTSDQVFITNGAQQGLTILSRLFLDPDAVAVIEEVTFTGIQQVTLGRRARVRTIRTNLETGAETDDLEEVFRQDPKPRLAILIPDFHNPLGVSLTAEKRRRIASLAAEYEVPLVEDDPYSALRFQGDSLPPIKAYDEIGLVFYLSSFSKMLAPGIRLGWIIAPADFIPKVTVIRESMDLETSTLTQRAVEEFLSRGYLEEYLLKLTSVNEERFVAIDQALEDHLGELASWTHPQGGLFTWVTLPDEVNAWDMFPKALERQVAYIPGAAFAVHGGHTNTMRLNFSNATPDEIEDAIHRLAEVIREQL
jgi:2-aminoadipate transaminase